MSRIAVVVLLSAASLLASNAKADTTLDFEDISTSGPIDSPYRGLNWDNFDVLPGSSLPGTGYYTGRASGDMVAFNDGGTAAEITTPAGETFTWDGGWFTGAWRDGLTMTMTGYNNGVQLYKTTFTIYTTFRTQVGSFWPNMDRLVFESSGGTPHYYYDPTLGDGTQFVMDDFEFNDLGVPPPPVPLGIPEPASWAMMLVGLGLAGAGLRRKRKGRFSERPGGIEPPTFSLGS